MAPPETPKSVAPPPGRAFQTRIGGVTGEGGDKLCPSCEARYPRDFGACPRDGTALVEIDDTVGTTLSGTYFVRRVLAEGAMGKVYEARHTRLAQKRFAVKMLHPEYVREPQILARFAREAEAAATLEHPHVAAVVDVDRTPDGRPFMVSELLQGKDFGDYLIEKGKLSVPAAVRIGLQIAGALSAAHARGIIHRDMKPENVFLTGDLASPIAKVLDFGMSRLDRGHGKQLTKAGDIVGTPSFMPPEQARGDRVDHRADVYALGAILYTALTGVRPFEAETPAQTLLAVLAGAPLPPRDIEPDIPEPLERLVLRAMAREPDDRFATMDELAQALARCDVHSGAPPVITVAAHPTPEKTLPDAGEDPLAAHAHTALDALLGATFGWGAATLSAALSALVRAVHAEGDTASAGESILVVAIVLVALGPALFLALRERVKGTWARPAQAAAIVRRAAPSVLGALAAYGLFASAVRGLMATFLGGRAPWPGWDVLLLLIGLGGAALPFVLLPQGKRRAPR